MNQFWFQNNFKTAALDNWIAPNHDISDITNLFHKSHDSLMLISFIFFVTEPSFSLGFDVSFEAWASPEPSSGLVAWDTTDCLFSVAFSILVLEVAALFG